MKLRASIFIDHEVKDFMAAADFQKAIEARCKELAELYPSVEFDVRERRGMAAREDTKRSGKGRGNYERKPGRARKVKPDTPTEQPSA